VLREVVEERGLELQKKRSSVLIQVLIEGNVKLK
jgi:hypothetical protein